MSEIFLYIWVVSISTGVFFYSGGEKVILFLLITYIISKGKIKIEKKQIILSVLMFFFLVVKGIGTNISRTASYHGLFAVYVGVFSVILTLFCFNSIVKEGAITAYRRNKCIKLFDMFFYLTIIITIIMLLYKGKGFYRTFEGEFSPVLAPQYFLIYSVLLGYTLSYKYVKKLEKRNFVILKLIVNAVFVFFMEYTTQLIFFVVAIVLGYVVANEKNIQKKTVELLLFVILTITIIPNLSKIIEYINGYFFTYNEDYSMRLAEISQYLKNGDLSGKAFGGRLKEMWKSLNSFQTYPIFGVPFSRYNLEINTKVGGHYEWVDDLAKYGIVGCWLYLSMIVYSIKIFVGHLKLKKNFCMGIFILLITYGFFNPIVRQSTLNVLFIVFFSLSIVENVNLDEMLMYST